MKAEWFLNQCLLIGVLTRQTESSYVMQQGMLYSLMTKQPR